MADFTYTQGYFSNWIIYVTVKPRSQFAIIHINFSNWIIYVTVKPDTATTSIHRDFSNWIIYVTVKPNNRNAGAVHILVTE